jgi:hypothetical protein
MKRKYFVILTTFFVVCSMQVQAAEKEEVQSLISIAEKRLEAIKQKGDMGHAKSEVDKISIYINEAKSDLKSGDEEMAYYKISIGMAYFRKIEASQELIDAETELNQIKDKLGK